MLGSSKLASDEQTEKVNAGGKHIDNKEAKGFKGVCIGGYTKHNQLKQQHYYSG
ncbi:hypothetical protein FLA_3823 [Filimonas lacunae]|nr:hypothetical protein FLA_3823 [Filimonas lacunae]